MVNVSLEEEWLGKFFKFLTNTTFNSTYKLIFMKSFLKLGNREDRENSQDWIKIGNDVTRVELDFIAVPYTKYYWDMFDKFDLRQSSTGNQYGDTDINIHKFFKDDQDDSIPPPSLEKLASNEYEEKRKNIIQKSIKPEVLNHLEVDPHGIPYGFYKRVKAHAQTCPAPADNTCRCRYESYIEVDSYALEFCNKYKIILDKAINFELVKYLEKINKAPRIAAKVEGKVPRSYLKSEQREFLIEFYRKCFYCEKPLSEGEDVIHIDHLIPFAYVYETELHNCVPACVDCNLFKSKRLPLKLFFNKKIEDNEKMNIRHFCEGYQAELYQEDYDLCFQHFNRESPRWPPEFGQMNKEKYNINHVQKFLKQRNQDQQ